WPSIRPMRTAPTGPKKGSGEMVSAADAPLIARVSWLCSPSIESTVPMICTSLRKPFGQSGRIGRSTMRAFRVAFSDALPSRLKKPPGILPAAYIFSSMSTVRGKKSVPSRASLRPTAVASTTVAPLRTVTAPWAWRASFPVVKAISSPPISTVTVVSCNCSSLILFPASSNPAANGAAIRGPVPGPVVQLADSTPVCSAAAAELGDQLAVGLEIGARQVVEQAAPPPHERQQPASRVVILLVKPQVLGQLVDARRQQRDLNLGGAGVLLVAAEFAHDLELALAGQRHRLSPSGISPPAAACAPGSAPPQSRDAGSVGALPEGGGRHPSASAYTALMETLVWSARPSLRKGVLVCAFYGWNDGGEEGTVSALFLRQQLGATQFCELDPDEFYDFQEVRPIVSLGQDDTRRMAWPENSFSWGSLPSGNDIAVMVGIEPQNRWKHYSRSVIEVARESGAELVVTLGGFLADTPPPRPVPVTGSADGDLADQLGLAPSTYEGPTGIVGVIHEACREVDMPSA